MATLPQCFHCPCGRIYEAGVDGGAGVATDIAYVRLVTEPTMTWRRVVTTGPQSCYPEEIETLQGMLKEQREKMARFKCAIQSDDVRAFRVFIKRRIEALTTAIEALGGAL